jgi:TonB family protein
MYGRRLTLTIIASVAIHAAFVLMAPAHQPPPPRQYRQQPRPVTVSVHRQAAKVASAAAKEAPKKPPEPRPAPPKPKTETVKPPPPKEAPPPKADPTPPPSTPEPAVPKKPAPFVLSNVALNGGVQVQAGASSNLFGDPAKDAAGFQKGSDAPGSVGGVDSGTGAGGTAAQPKKVVVKPPEAIGDARGAYPPEHRDLGRVVRVELLLTLNPAGEVVDIRVRQGDLPAFDEEAKRTARKIRFRPATRDGVPIPYEIKWTIVFLPEA